MKNNPVIWSHWLLCPFLWKEYFTKVLIKCLIEWKMCRRLLGKKSANSVTRLGHIWKFFGTKFLSKVAQIFSNNFGLLWKIELFTLHWCGYFLGNFCRKLGYFLLQDLVTLITSLGTNLVVRNWITYMDIFVLNITWVAPSKMYHLLCNCV